MRGPAASDDDEMEQIAEAGEIVVSAATAALLPKGSRRGPGQGRTIAALAPAAGRRAVGADRAPGSRRRCLRDAYVPVVPARAPARRARRRARAPRRHRRVRQVQGRRRLARGGRTRCGGRRSRRVGHHRCRKPRRREELTFLATDVDADGGKIILTAGVPVTHGRRRGSLAARGPAHRRDAPSALPVRDRREPRSRVRRRGRIDAAAAPTPSWATR